jgi:hypothetical protein
VPKVVGWAPAARVLGTVGRLTNRRRYAPRRGHFWGEVPIVGNYWEADNMRDGTVLLVGIPEVGDFVGENSLRGTKEFLNGVSAIAKCWAPCMARSGIGARAGRVELTVDKVTQSIHQVLCLI